jgi:hypothetical protein
MTVLRKIAGCGVVAALHAWKLISAAACFAVFGACAATTPIITVTADFTGEAIQHALDQLPDSGGEILLSPGTYDIRQPILLRRDNQALCGSGMATVLRLADKADCPVVVLGSPGTQPVKAVVHLWVSDLYIDGNRAGQSSERWKGSKGVYITNNGIDVEDVWDTTVERVTCCHCRSGGLVTANGTRRLVVLDFGAFDNEFDGLACYGTEESLFSRLFLHDNMAAGISLDLAFTHNVISDAVLTGNEHGIFMRDTQANIFQGLVIRASRKHGVFMGEHGRQTPDGWKPLPGTECSDNSFMGIVISGSGGAGFYPTDDCCPQNQISGAQLFNNAAGAIRQGLTNLFTISGTLGN